MLQQEEDDLQRDCTFAPQINPHPSHQQRGEFLAEAQLRERRKRLQQLLAADNDARDDAVVRTLRSAISQVSPNSVAMSGSTHRSPASALQFSPALSLAASIVGAGGVGGGSSSAAAHGRHEDPDLKGDLDANAAAAVGAVEKVRFSHCQTLLSSSCLMCRYSLHLLQSCLRAMMTFKMADTIRTMSIMMVSKDSGIVEGGSRVLLPPLPPLLLMRTAQIV